jgi:hypothetical protein
LEKTELLFAMSCHARLLPGKRYAWDLFEAPSDDAPVETVTVDANLSRKMQIDDEVSVELDRSRGES